MPRNQHWSIARLLALSCLLSIVTSACVTAPVPRPSAGELARITDTQSTHATLPINGTHLLELTPAMRSFAHRYVPAKGTSQVRLRELLRALISVHDIDYELNANLTASQAFEQRRANCLAFSSLVVAMADEIGINAWFQEVDLPPTWEGGGSDLLMRLRHVNVITDVSGSNGHTVVDFRSDRYDESLPRQAITHDQAIARFYNNLGIEALLAEDYQLARDYLIAALQIEPKLEFGWVNLGQLYRRQNDLDSAQIAYRQALAISPSDPSALINLSSVYSLQGRVQEARELRLLAQKRRERDPYYGYAMAQRAAFLQQWSEAADWLYEAIDRRPREHRFHHLLGLAQWELGQRASAAESMQAAAELATDRKDIRRYEQQLALWDDNS